MSTSAHPPGRHSIKSSPKPNSAGPDDVAVHLAKAAEKQQRQQQRAHKTRTALGWVAAHPWWSGAFVLLVLGLITTIIMLSVCATRYCPGIPLYTQSPTPVRNSPDPSQLLAPWTISHLQLLRMIQVDEPAAGPPRLILQFRDPSVNALSVLPAVLQPYANNTMLSSSSLQLLHFIDEDTLNSAKEYLASRTDLLLLVRDFAMRRFPNDMSAQIGLNASALLTDVLSQVEQTAQDPGLQNETSGSLETWLSSVFYGSSSDSGTDGSSSSSSNSGSSRRRALQQLTPTQLPAPYAANDPLVQNGTQWFHSKIQSDRAWLISKGSADVIVAIVDTGADLNHSDLRDNLWVNTREIPGNGIDDDGNGYIDDVHGWDFAGACSSHGYDGSCICGSRATPIDDDGHGTHVAGIVAAVQDNSIGGSGVAPRVKLMILRVADCLDGSIYASAVVEAYDYALQMGAHVVQCSFGMSYPDYFSPISPAPWYEAGQNQVYDQAVAPLQAKGMLLVAAAGNEYLNLDQLSDLGYAYNPCLVNRSNVLCVAASDASDQLTNFTNRGVRTVHVAAPGLAIVSTWPGGTYNSLSGTSMAAPQVSGVAAIAMSILGTTSGNFYQADAVKALIMSSGDQIAALEVVSQARVNAFNTSMQALRQVASVEPAGSPTSEQAAALVLATPSLAASTQLPLYIRGFTETYINWTAAAWATPLQQLPSGSALDVSVLPASSPLRATFSKYGPGAAVVLTAYLYLGSTGACNVQVTVAQVQAGAPPVVLLIGTSRVPLTDSGSGVFQIAATGYFAFELQLPLPITLVDLQVTDPSGNLLNATSSFYTTAGGQPQAPTGFAASGSAAAMGWAVETSSCTFQPPGLQLVSGWQMQYNLAPSTPDSDASASVTRLAALSKAALSASSTSSTFSYLAVLPDLNYLAVPLLAQDLLQGSAVSAAQAYGGASLTAVVGRATTRLQTQGVATSFVLSTTCNRCTVWLDGLLVLDNWEGLTQDPPLPLRKNSSCISMPQGSPPPVLMATFAAPSLQLAQLNIGWLPCDEPWGDLVMPLASNTSIAALWEPDAGAAGQIPGVQCDVFRSATLPAQAPYPWRTDRGASAPGAPAFKQRLTLGPWSWSVGDLFPSLLARFPPGGTYPQLYSARCWTYLSPMAPGSSSTLGLAVELPSIVSGASTPQATASMQLAGRQIWPLPSSGSLLQEPALVTDTWRSLLVVEWQNLAIDTRLTVSFGGATLAIGSGSMLLPLLVRFPSAPPFTQPPPAVPTSWYNPALPFLGPAGHTSNTSLADSYWDAPAEVQYDQTSLVFEGSFESPDYGLTGQFFYSPTLSTQLRYTLAEGYLWAVAEELNVYTLRMLDGSATATALVMAPGVSVINPRPFAGNNSLSAVSVSVVLPQGYVYTEAIAKTNRPDGQTAFYMDIQLPDNPDAGADGPVDQTVWFRPYGRGY